MANINQYRSGLEDVLANQLSIHHYTIPTPHIRDVLGTNPGYADSLRGTYGLSLKDLQESVYRIGIGRKLSEAHSDIYENVNVKRPKVDPERGIVCPKGILTFYEDVLYWTGRDVRVLAASYHFQTASQINNSHPLYVRFEFDPLFTTPSKPIFHYHFSNYEWFHKGCHFPAGHFEVPSHHPFDDEEMQQRFSPPKAPNLRSFLQLLVRAGLIPEE